MSSDRQTVEIKCDMLGMDYNNGCAGHCSQIGNFVEIVERTLLENGV
jgi:hypothetical protein